MGETSITRYRAGMAADPPGGDVAGTEDDVEVHCGQQSRSDRGTIGVPREPRPRWTTAGAEQHLGRVLSIPDTCHRRIPVWGITFGKSLTEHACPMRIAPWWPSAS